MSGIFGFIAKHSDEDRKSLHALDIFNRCYGHGTSDMLLTDRIGIGCHQDHFSDAFSASAPVIQKGNIIAVIDALLYNRDELLSLLDAEPDISDEELLLLLIQTKGFDALANVNGDFAGAIYDQSSDEWTLFRDHSGVRPLFYYTDENFFAFSTDMRGLTALPNADMSVNESTLFVRMAGYNPLTLCETDYKNIHCIHPASWTVFSHTTNGFDQRENIYWKWRQKKIRMKSDTEYQKELRRLITDSIKRRLDAVSGIVGCELSGGLDSSVIAILINRLGREGRYYSWSISPDELPMRQDRDERSVIFDICKQENIGCEFSKMDKHISIDTVMKDMVVPYANTRSIAKGSKYMNSQGVRVMFTGHGGDEGVSHRCNFYELWVHHEYAAFFRNIYRRTEGKNLRLLRTTKHVLHQLFVQHPHFRAPYRKIYSSASMFLNEDFKKRMSEIEKPKPHYFAYKPYEYIMQGGHRVRLDNVAVQGAENGIRYLTPFIDYRLLDFALSIPRAQFHNGYTNRYIYRMAMDDLLPQSLRDVHYKDTPSQENVKDDVDPRIRFAESHAQLMKYFDTEYWKDYLNSDAIRNYKLPVQFTRSMCVNAGEILGEVLTCCIIQNLPRSTAEWCENHE